MYGKRGKRRAIAAASLCGLALLVASCGDSKLSTFNKVGAPLGSAKSNAGQASVAGAVPTGAPLGKAPDAKRDVIYTGSLTVKVDDAKAAAQDATHLAEQAGGYLAGSAADLTGDREVRVTLKVPADAFDQVLTDLAKQGDVQARKIDSKDVTDAIVDLQGRLDNAKTSATRLRELLAKAENVQNIITIEDRLGQRELEIEGIGRQLQGLQNQVTYATVRVTFTERSTPKVSDRLPGPLAALRAGAVTVANLAILAVGAAAFLVPFLPFLLLGWYLLRRRKQRRASSAAPPNSAPQPPAGQPLPPPPAT